MDSTNVVSPFFGRRQPDYPPLSQLVRIPSPVGTIAGPSAGSSYVAGGAGSGVGVSVLYLASTQQLRTDTLLPRDREPCLAVDVVGAGLLPGLYLGRLAGTYRGLPVYEVVGFSAGAVPYGSSSSVPGALYLPGLTQSQAIYLTANLDSAQLYALSNLTACQLQVLVQLPLPQIQQITSTLTPPQLTNLIDGMTYTQLTQILTSSTPSQIITATSAVPAMWSSWMSTLTVPQIVQLITNLTSQQISTLVGLTPQQLLTVTQLSTPNIQLLTSLTTAQVTTLVGQLTPTQLTSLLTTLSTPQLQQLTNNLTPAQIQQLLLAVTPGQLQTLVANLTPAQLVALTQYPPSTINTLVTTMTTANLKTFLGQTVMPPSPYIGSQAYFPEVPVVVGQPSAVPTPIASGYGAVVLDTGGKLWGYVAGAWTNLSATGGSGVTTTAEGTLAATGSVQGDAAQIVTDNVVVSGADGTKGVILPDVAGARVVVSNTASLSALKVYPPSGAKIGGGATNAPDNLTFSTSTIYYRVSSTQWYRQPMAA